MLTCTAKRGWECLLRQWSRYIPSTCHDGVLSPIPAHRGTVPWYPDRELIPTWDLPPKGAPFWGREALTRPELISWGLVGGPCTARCQAVVIRTWFRREEFPGNDEYETFLRTRTTRSVLRCVHTGGSSWSSFSVGLDLFRIFWRTDSFFSGWDSLTSRIFFREGRTRARTEIERTSVPCGHLDQFVKVCAQMSICNWVTTSDKN